MKKKIRSEASRKAWRTRKRMKAARSAAIVEQARTDRATYEYVTMPTADDVVRRRVRALPNPWLDMFK